MSRRLAGAVFALIFAGSAGSGLLAIRNKPQASDAPKKSPEAAATEALNSGLTRLEKADRLESKNPKQARKEYEAALKDFQTAADSDARQLPRAQRRRLFAAKARQLRARARELRTRVGAGADVI